ATELFKYQILLDHLRLDKAHLVADSYFNSSTPYSDTMAALNERFGQPRKLAFVKIARVMDSPDLRRGDTEAFDKFDLQIRALVGSSVHKRCSNCGGKHLQILHEFNIKGAKGDTCLVSSTAETLYLDRPTDCRGVLLKVIRVLISYGGKTLNTYAVMDDGSEQTILLPDATRELGIQGQAESIALWTIRQEVQTVSGLSVSFHIFPADQPQKIFRIAAAFTAKCLGLANHSYPLSILKEYKHLKDLPLQAFVKVSPLLLTGADNTNLITPIAHVRLGPPGGPATINTKLGWTLQGPVRLLETQFQPHQCLFLSHTPTELELKRDVEKLWLLDVLPFRCEKQVTRSREDRQAINLLETKMTKVEVNGIYYAMRHPCGAKGIPPFSRLQRSQ
ncbi:hypothetical protein QTP70_028155, partial [Hemibagrus guttatus]